MYQCIVTSYEYDVCCPIYYSITKVCKFLETVDFDHFDCVVVCDNGRIISGKELLEVWNG